MISYIREYKFGDKEKIFELIREVPINNVWGIPISFMIHKTWDWLFLNNPLNPDGSAHILVSEINSNIIGFIGNIFVDLKVDNKIIKARWGWNFITHPRHRNRGIRLFKMYLDMLSFPCFGFPGRRAVVLEAKLGVHKITSIYRQIRILNMKVFLQNKLTNRTISYLGGLIWDIISKACFKTPYPDKNISVTEIASFDDRFNKFWQEVSIDYPIIIVRNQRYLNWRFIEAPFKYHIFTAIKDDNILGYIVLRQEERNGLKRGYIVDILTKANDIKTLNALISKAVSYFKENKCDVAECLVLTNKKAYQKALTKQCFMIKRFIGYFVGYSKDEEVLSLIKNPDNWFITASDPDLDV